MVNRQNLIDKKLQCIERKLGTLSQSFSSAQNDEVMLLYVILLRMVAPGWLDQMGFCKGSIVAMVSHMAASFQRSQM